MKASTSTTENSADQETVTLKPADTNLEIRKGLCVQNQLQLWEKLLEIRIHSQKILIKANSLPHFKQIEDFQQKDSAFSGAVQETTKNVGNLLQKMSELQSALITQFPETAHLGTKRKRKAEQPAEKESLPKMARHLEDSFSDYKDYRDTVILKWYDRTKILTPGSKEAKHQGLNSLNILQNIQSVLANKAQLIKKTQLHKGGYDIIGVEKKSSDENHVEASTTTEGTETIQANEEYFEEIYDDTDFYHTQLRELIEFKANTTNNPMEMTKQLVEMEKLRKKMKKVVDTRASKGRKIRYVVHNKMVNFMAPHNPTEWTDDAKNELYSSLFGAQVQ